MIDSNLIHVVTTSITDKIKCLQLDPMKIQTNVYIREASSFSTMSAFISIFSTPGISEIVSKTRWCR
jgi:hypothetical protein